MRLGKPAVNPQIFLRLWMICVVVVIIGSLAPANTKLMQFVDGFNVNDKIQHACSYLVLAFLPVLARRRIMQGYALGASMAVLGVVLEFAQALSPGRTPDVFDAIADFCGVAVGLLLGRISRNYFDLSDAR